MAFLKETVGSLRAYFILVAVLVGVGNLVTLVNFQRGLVTAVSLVGLCFAIAYGYLGVRLKHLLATSPAQIAGVLMAGAAFLLLGFFYSAFLGIPGTTPVQPIVGLLFTWYLWKNVRRLAAEAQRTPQQP